MVIALKFPGEKEEGEGEGGDLFGCPEAVLVGDGEILEAKVKDGNG
jgi:hypothetical protein